LFEIVLWLGIVSLGNLHAFKVELSKMTTKPLLKIGIVGTVLAALCCFTPVLAVLLVSVGLSAAVGYLDLVLIPALLIFVGITLYALWRTRQRSDSTAE